MQREAEDRAGETPGGLTREDLGKLNRAEWNRDREAADERAERRAEAEQRAQDQRDAQQPGESIMDEVDPDNTAAMRSEGLMPDEGPVLTGGMLDALKKPENMIRLAGMGLGLIGLLLLFWGLQVEAQQVAPGSTLSSPTPTTAPAGSPLTQASPPVSGSATANASFTKVSGPCNLAARFSDRYSFMATNGALTLTQLSNNHVSRGTISPNGEFTTMAEGQGYRGRISGTSAEGQHTYTAQGCNELYNFTMTFQTAFLATGTSGQQANRPPEAGAIQATQVGTTTSYTVQNVRDPDGDTLRYLWTTTNQCGPPVGHSTPTLSWPHPHPPCPEEPVHPATITVTIDDGRFSIRREYLRGSAAGLGTVPAAGVGISTIAPSPTAAIPTTTSRPTTAAPTATGATTTTTGGPNLPLILLGTLFLLGGLGIVWRGPFIWGGPRIRKEEPKDPCEREKANEAAARARLNAARARMDRISSLADASRQAAQNADAAARAAEQAKVGASYGETRDAQGNVVRVYTNKAQAAKIAAADAAAAAARDAAAQARSAFNAAGGQAELGAAQDELYKANRDWEQANESLQRCLKLFAPPPPPPPPPTTGGTSTGGTSTGTGGVTVSGGGGPTVATGGSTQTRERKCKEGDIKDGSERITTREIKVNELNRAEIVLDATYPGAQYTPITEFIEWMDFIRKSFKAGKAINTVINGTLVEGTLDTIDATEIADIPDFTTYWDKLTEATLKGLKQTTDIFIDRFSKLGSYSLRYTRRTHTATCRVWEECDGSGNWVSKRELKIEITKTEFRKMTDPIEVHDKREIAPAIDRLFTALARENERGTRDLKTFEERCGK